MSRRFVTLDVFTDRRLAGNPLAVVLDADGLDTAAMQAITREFNLSETVFVLPPDAPRHRARLRIFTPGREMPFAGHPTVGTAVLLALEDRRAGRTDAVAFGLEEGIGTVPCVVEVDAEAGRGRARFRVPKLPEVAGEGLEPASAAWILGLDPAEIGFDRHVPSRYAAGNVFDFVPLRSREALARIRPNPEAIRQTLGEGAHPAFYAYTRETEGAGHHFRARMFAPGFGLTEDPATGSAAANFSGVLMQFEPLGEGTHDLVIEQGYEMGRPSEIALQVTIADGALQAAEIGGGAIVVSEGTLRL
jgi:trans-2,3-dihydro-3-hydroxyanthranilate isomerase